MAELIQYSFQVIRKSADATSTFCEDTSSVFADTKMKTQYNYIPDGFRGTEFV